MIASPDPSWRMMVRPWAVFTAVGLILATVLYALDSSGLLVAAPEYRETSAGQLQDEATYFAALFEARHAIWWNHFLRDTLYFFAFLGFVPILLALDAVTSGRALVRLAAAFIVIGAVFGSVNALTYLVIAGYWQGGGWDTVPAEVMVAVGRGTELVDGISTWFGTASNAALAIGLAYLALAARRISDLPRWLGVVSWVGAAALAVMVIIPQLPFDTGPTWDLLALMTGVIMGPGIALGVAWALPRPAEGT